MPNIDFANSNNLFQLILLLAIAAVVSWLNNRFGTKKTRGLIDTAANSNAGHLDAMVKIADRGTSKSARQSLDRTVYPATLGLRLIGSTIIAGLLIFLWRNPYFFVSSDYDLTFYVAACGLALWYIAYLWHYEVSVEGTEISVPTYWFKPRIYDLNDLIDVEDDGAYAHRLILTKNRKPLVLKHLDGQSDLNAIFDHYRQITDAGIARS